jgi:cytoskeletal protein RodZ
MAMPSAVTVGSLAFVVAAGAGLVAISASASEDGSTLPPPAPAASHSTGSPHSASPGHDASPAHTASPERTAPPVTAKTLTAPTKTTTPSAPTRSTTQTPTATAPAKTTTPTATAPAKTTTPTGTPPQRTPRQSQNPPQTHPDAVPTVLVEVYNNSGITGLAAQRAAVLQGAGWNVAATDNWYGNIPENTVYYPPQLRDEAVRLANVLGVQRLIPAVAPMQFDRLTVIFVSA